MIAGSNSASGLDSGAAGAGAAAAGSLKDFTGAGAAAVAVGISSSMPPASFCACNALIFSASALAARCAGS